MAAGRGLVVAAGFLLMLGGCVTGGGSGSYGYEPPGYGYGRGPSYRHDYEPPRRMSGRSMAALAEGCRQRFHPGTNKYTQCVNGERKSEDSLVEGCTRLYKNDRNAYGRCLQGR